MKRILLATSALAGAALLANTAVAGTPNVGDNLEVSISGNGRFAVTHGGGKIKKNNDRGFAFNTDESEIKFAAKGTSDTGLDFGLEIEIQTQTTDTENVDEMWIFIGGDFGRIELGDQDGAADRMFVGAEDVMAGRGGFDGTVGRHSTITGVATPSFAKTSDATKAIYFTPRVAGFQAGISFTPDTGNNGGTRTPDIGTTTTTTTITRHDADGNPATTGDIAVLSTTTATTAVAATNENVVSVGANYSGNFGDVGVKIGVAGEFGKAEDTRVTNTTRTITFNGATPATAPAVTNTPTSSISKTNNVEIIGIGGSVSFAGFTVGAGYADLGKTGVAESASRNGADAGSWWDVGAKYGAGPWNVSVGVFSSEQSVNRTTKNEVDIYSLTGDYTIAPGLKLAADINRIKNKVGSTSNSGHEGVFSLQVSF